MHDCARLSRLLVLGFLTVLLAGCSLTDVVVIKRPAPGISIKTFPLDLVYGAEPPPPGVTATVPVPELFPGPAPLELPPYTFPSFAPSAVGPCPEPGNDVFPAEPAAQDVSKPTVAGRYVFKQSGTLELVGLAKIPIQGLTFRTVKNVAPGANGVFTYDYDLGTLGPRAQVQSFQVTPGANSSLPQPPAPAPQPPVSTSGIKLTRLRTTVSTTSGPVTYDFQPTVPVQVFPLPVAVGSTFADSGVDPRIPETIQVQGTVGTRERVDGCNEVVDAWGVDETWVFTPLTPGSTPTTYTLHFAIAPQLGGFFTLEHLKTTETLGPFVANYDITSALGHSAPQGP